MSDDLAGKSLSVDPPLTAEEVAFLAGFGRAAVPAHAGGARDVPPLRRVWPGQPGSWSPWVPCRDGCCLVLGPRSHPDDAAVWLRFLVSRFLKTRTRDRADAPDGLTFDHRVDGRLVFRGADLLDVRVLTVRRNRVSERCLTPEPGGPPWLGDGTPPAPRPRRVRRPAEVVDLSSRRRDRRSLGGTGGLRPQSTER
jgi:hypothetical protein